MKLGNSTHTKKGKIPRKNKKTRKNRRHNASKNIILGGDIYQHPILKYIKSIGFEIETTGLVKFTLEPDKYSNKQILVNSSLSNIDLENGFEDPYEYTYIIQEKDNTPDEKPILDFKITNDSADDSYFNDYINEKIKIHKPNHNENGDDSDGDDDDMEYDSAEVDDGKQPLLRLVVPTNQYLTQPNYDILIKESDTGYNKYSTLTDVEWIATYYKPTAGKNIIFDYFLKTMEILQDHLNKLVPLRGTVLQYLDKDNNYVDFKELNKTKLSYVLPETSLVYFCPEEKNRNYNVKNDLIITPQTTVVCEIQYVYRVMKKLASYDNISSPQNLSILSKYLNAGNEEFVKLYESISDKNNTDIEDINIAQDIVKKMFDLYNQNPKNSDFVFNNEITEVQTLKSYFFLIIYKLYIYLNGYLYFLEKDPLTMFKYSFAFVIRHDNFVLYSKIKDLIKTIFASKFMNKNEKAIDKVVRLIIQKLTQNTSTIYFTEAVQSKHEELVNLVKNNPELREQHYGDPLYSIPEYFEYFETKKDVEIPDWLVNNGIDEKSSKFELINNDIMMEFRGFYYHIYLYMFVTGNDEIRNQLIKHPSIYFYMKTMNEYLQYIKNSKPL